MSTTVVALLPDRGVVSLSGTDAADFLDNIVTNDLSGIRVGEARFAGLLTPQGKILFEFFALRTEEGFLLDTRADRAADLLKRLTMYKLRAKITLADVSPDYGVAAAWGPEAPSIEDGWCYADPRNADLGWRLIVPRAKLKSLPGQVVPEALYHERRVALGVAEGGFDYALGDTFPHEANYDRLHGVSFTKGCFVGQEVVARMQNKTVVRKRVTLVTGPEPLTTGAEIKIGAAVIGTVGSVAGPHGLALLRIDRAAEAADKGEPLTAGAATIVVDTAALDRYRASAAARASAP
ncbi:folate-binding protein YgfZ [Hyphomicrobium sp. CS1BSMeth3]|uniref:CAF17-like 4Fe-4S cluster assembly/insertion protein YgfZ n=1 Tax=Hyphomicrobium sp. CS1BSMeth3 TaxID=1892844 RepID=UPI00092FF449|nr:folate-binding protein YgfZ [Hyphomicrobium sp. CS1BSMeth3]